jgi:hypothetical protein
MREERKVYKVLVGKPEEKRPLGRPSCDEYKKKNIGCRPIQGDSKLWNNTKGSCCGDHLENKNKMTFLFRFIAVSE